MAGRRAGGSKVEVQLAQYFLGRRHVFRFGLRSGVLRVAVPLHLLIGPTLARIGSVALPVDLGRVFHDLVRAFSLPDFQVESQLAVLSDIRFGLRGHGIERRDPLPGGPLQLIGEPFGIVRDEFGRVPRPAYGNIEGLPVDQLAVAGGHCRNDPVHRPALKGVDCRRPGMVDVTQLGILAAEFRLRSVLQTEADAVLVQGFHLGNLSVGEIGGWIVAREPNTVAAPKLHRFASEHLDPALGGCDPDGIPLDQVGATGYGLAVCAETAQEFVDCDLKGARVSIQGFGNVGQHAARYLVHPQRGAIVTAASDRDGTIYNADGLDVEELCEHMQEHRGVTGFAGGEPMPIDAFETIDCDIFVPAAQPDVINEQNAGTMKCKLILQGANIPATREAEQILHERGIVSVPDFVANAGGVICGSVEYRGGTKSNAFHEIEEKVKENTHDVLRFARIHKETPRAAALVLAQERVREAMSYRRAN